jgi:hypothetical protein
MRGDLRANTIMKAVTKAKRRVTLSISGLGFLDETEVETIPGAKKAEPVALRPVELSTGTRIDRETGEITETTAPDPAASPGAVEAAPPSDTPESGAALSLLDMAREAARRGEEPFRVFWKNRTREQREQVTAIGKELAELRDAAKREANNGR